MAHWSYGDSTQANAGVRCRGSFPLRLQPIRMVGSVALEAPCGYGVKSCLGLQVPRSDFQHPVDHLPPGPSRPLMIRPLQ